MNKFKRLDIREASIEFPLLNEEARKALKGGCAGCPEWTVSYPGMPIWTEDEYLRQCDEGTWTGGLVCGWGYMHPEAVVYGAMGYCNRHQEYYQDGMCYSCYMKDNYCNLHGEYFCYECSQPGGTSGEDGSDEGGHIGGSGSGGGSGGGSGPGGGSGGDVVVVIPPGSGVDGDVNISGNVSIQSIVDANAGDSFQVSDKVALENALKLIGYSKAGNFLLTMLTDKDIWMRFEIGDTKLNQNPGTGEWEWSPAICDPANDRIVFRSSGDIEFVNLTEELIHTYQKSIYGSEMTTANPNYEFEAKIIRDIITGSGSLQLNLTGDNTREDYWDYIDGIKDGSVSTSLAGSQYGVFYSKWDDPTGIKQNIKPDSPYYYDNGLNNTFDAKVLNIIIDYCRKH